MLGSYRAGYVMKRWGISMHKLKCGAKNKFKKTKVKSTFESEYCIKWRANLKGSKTSIFLDFVIADRCKRKPMKITSHRRIGDKNMKLKNL